MKNKLSDLNDYLFMQLERLNDEELKGKPLKDEIERGKAMSLVASQIVNTHKVKLDAYKLIKDELGKDEVMKILNDFKQNNGLKIGGLQNN